MLFSKIISLCAFALSVAASPVPAAEETAELVARDAFQTDIINAHNTYRKQHGAVNIKWNATLATYAAPNSNSCKFHHTEKGKYGENIAAGYANTTAAVQAWGNERDKYDFKGEFTETTGHFTQMVWKASTTVGCAQKACPNMLASGITSVYLVCEYWPRGNIISQFLQNVGKRVA